VPALRSFDYAVIRVVPRVDREEFVNAGVILYCSTLRLLTAAVALDEHRLLALAPDVDIDLVHSHLASIPRICAGGDGPIGALSPVERFDWLVAPRSTIIQTSPVHAGLCADPQQALDHLMSRMVHTPSR
jgi:hypothetical protein